MKTSALEIFDAAPAKTVEFSPKQNFTVGELFAGAGGLALGASQAKHNGKSFFHAWATDIDQHACATFQRNFPKTKVLCCPVEKLDFSKLDRPDGLAFGFPCNDFSIVGDRRGTKGKYGKLYLQAVTALEALRPVFFVAENVVGIRNSNGSADFKKILGAFEQAGYSLKIKELRFDEYGVPQSRRRVIIVGFLRSSGLAESFLWPKKTSKKKTAREALESPPIAGDAANHELTKQSPHVVERLEYIKPGENVFTAKMPKRMRLQLNCNAKISQIYRRLEPDKPSYTVTGSGGGGTHVYHWKENRALTNRERARLQTFPDDFVFCGGKEAVRKQIGMAVPPRAAKLIFREALRVLSNYVSR